MPRNDGPSRERSVGSHAALEQIEAEHRLLLETLAKVEATTDPCALLPLLEGLREALISHFASEEAPDGMQDLVLESGSHLLGDVERIFDDHRLIIDELDRLAADLRAFLEGPIRESHDRAKALCAHLRRHEEEETRIMSEAVYTDLGGGS